VSSYRAKDALRYTLIVPYRCQVETPYDLSLGDGSVDAARWIGPTEAWDQLAPANRVALSHLIWPRLTVAEQAVAERAVMEALDICAGWGATLGLPHLPGPWAGGDELLTWRRTWPG
jgi:hypothetical protein